ncbi:MAG: hypothetical protein WCX32_02100 [Clostridia bacterium]|jgi:hypothetical protein|nr:hypothetical protein [Clostridia bacterium]
MKQDKKILNKPMFSKSDKKFVDNEDTGDIEQSLIAEITEDFKTRQSERKSYESQWQLNTNFLIGNQYCTITPQGEVQDNDKQYFWQEREVYNHISALVETRLSKLNRFKPVMTVIPTSADEHDLNCAKLSKNIINSVYHRIDMSKLISQATMWSEVCGTAFYKVIWDSNSGQVVAKNSCGAQVHEGDIEIVVCPPYEIFPDNVSCKEIEECRSVIHARAYHIDTIKDIWGVEVQGEDIDVFSLDNVSTAGGLGYTASVAVVAKQIKHNHAIVIEKYEAPSLKYPNGRLIIIAGNKLLHIGEMPYINGASGKRTFPFIKQNAIENNTSLWGTSVIERTIPVQRAYNAVKNRKHEFLNRISMGVLTIEDGSVDTENLEEEGLSPGKVLVYRQGSNPPSMMGTESVPLDFTYEEERLLNEFMVISGVSDLMRNSHLTNSSISGVALELLAEQDDTRLSSTIDNIKTAVCTVSKHILRLYKQYVKLPRLARVVGKEGSIEVYYFSSSDITSEDIIFETETQLGETPVQKRNMILELLKAGLLHDENGKLSNTMRIKALELMGFGLWDNSQDLYNLHIKRAKKENLQFLTDKEYFQPEEIDNHDLHIDEHTAFMLGAEYEKAVKHNEKLRENMLQHIRAHKQIKQFMLAQENALPLGNIKAKK